MNIDIKEQNRKTYNLLAPQYEQKSISVSDFKGHTISKFAKHVSTGKNILDVGCGVGVDTSIFAQLGYSMTGIDFSEKMADYAKQRNPDAKIIIGDFKEEKFDKLYDGIFAQAFIHLFPKSEAEFIIKKIKSLLVPNGVACITTTKNNKSEEGFYAKNDYNGHPARFRKFWTKDELAETLTRLDFKIADYFEIVCPYGKERIFFIVKNDGGIHSASYVT